MITKELESVWITSDGKKFLSKKEAHTHELDIYPGDIVESWTTKTSNNKEKSTWLEKLFPNKK